MSEKVDDHNDRGPIPRANRALIDLFEPLATWLEKNYFDAEVRGLERIPDGPALLLGNHNAGVMIPDSIIFYRQLATHGKIDDVPVSLAHQLLFRIPLLKDLVQGLALVPASPKHGRVALEQGRKVLVYPGGDWEAMRPSADRDRVDFAGRTGFVRLALETGVPIVPVVSAGAHDGWYVLTRGDGIARRLRLDRLLRIKVFPIALALPTGLVTGPIPLHIPLPGKIIIEVLEPIELEGDPEDDELVEQAYDQILSTMQTVLDELAAQLPRPGIVQRLRQPFR